jgi:MarR family transcriptional regulator for hemolysin
MSLDRASSAGYLTNWAARLFGRAIHQRLKPIGVAPGQLPVFFALAGGEAMTQKALAEIAAIEQPTMAATLSRMERDGLITRKPDPADGRSALVALTPAALDKARHVQAAVSGVNATALEGLGKAEREQFLQLLRGVIARLEDATRDRD